MSVALYDVLASVPVFAMVFARVGAATALLPALGEASAPSLVRIGIALSITALLVPSLAPPPSFDRTDGMATIVMIISEVLTGLWFGWLARIIVLALPVGGQYISYLVGMSSVLQPDPELGSQSTAFGRLFEMTGPLLLLITGLYTVPLTALAGLFKLVPLGQLLPSVDSTQVAVDAVATAFNLALQLASPFVVVSVIWHVAIGQLARMASRMQIYFVSMPGQIFFGLLLFMTTIGAVLAAWQAVAQTFMMSLPGNG
jgi:flagellar biosynthetic protein FliR